MGFRQPQNCKKNMSLKGNKGEWSEYYTFLKLLADGKIYAADKDLNKNENLFYLILKIIRGEFEDLEYIRDKRIIIQSITGEILSEIPIKEIEKFSNLFYKGISEGKKSFELDFANSILTKLHTSSISDERKETADIRIVIRDPITQHEPLLGFSIKSYIGGKPTLFNASKNSNLIYQIKPNLEQREIIHINNLETYSTRIKWLKEKRYDIYFKKMNSEIFRTNLELIDSRLPEILSHMLLYKYLSDTNKLLQLIEFLNKTNPCNFNIKLNPNFYTYKVKRFLVDAALGMKAGKLWTGNFSATGGYIAVKKDGELLCYHIYNWNDFQYYLINNTKIDLPDSSPHRCDFGRILKASEVDESEGTYIKLNFQIRFI
jgi:HpaII restriction endonuclease